MLTLHHSPASPFVRKVMVTLHETGQLDRVRISPSVGTAIDPGTMPVAANPLGKIPALERPDGCTLFDSRVITRYLASLTDNTLYPAGDAGWEVQTLEALGDGILEAAVLIRYEIALRPQEQQSPAWLDGQWVKIARSLDSIESRWMAHLAGPLSAAQIAIGCALGYLDFRHSDRDWRADHAALAAWFETFNQRASMQATLPPIA